MLPTFRILFVAAAVALVSVLIAVRGVIPAPEAYTRIGEVPSIGRPLMQQAMVPRLPSHALARQEESAASPELTGLAPQPRVIPRPADAAERAVPSEPAEPGSRAADTSTRIDAAKNGNEPAGAPIAATVAPSPESGAAEPAASGPIMVNNPPETPEPAASKPVEAPATSRSASAPPAPDPSASPAAPDDPSHKPVAPGPPPSLAPAAGAPAETDATRTVPAAGPQTENVTAAPPQMEAANATPPAGQPAERVATVIGAAEAPREGVPAPSAAAVVSPPNSSADLASAATGIATRSLETEAAAPDPAAAVGTAAAPPAAETKQSDPVPPTGPAAGKGPPSLAFADEIGHSDDAGAPAEPAGERTAEKSDGRAAAAIPKRRSRPVIASLEDRSEAEPRRKSAGHVVLKKKPHSVRASRSAKRDVSSRRSRVIKQRESRRSAATAARKKRRVVRRRHRSERHAVQQKTSTQSRTAAGGVQHVPHGYRLAPSQTSTGYPVYYPAPAGSSTTR